LLAAHLSDPLPRLDPIEALRAAVFALRQMQICARVNAIKRFKRNVRMNGQIQSGFAELACASLMCSSAIHGLLNSRSYQSPPSSQ
jgi:hypothetical protein